MANGPEDVIFKTETGAERVTDLEDASLEDRMDMAHQAVRMMDSFGNKADYTLTNGQFQDNSDPYNGWTVFTRTQPLNSGLTEYHAVRDDKELLLNVSKSTGDYHL